MTSERIFSPHSSLLSSLKVPNRHLCGPGPSNMHENVAQAMSMPLLGHLHPEFVEIMDQCREGIKYLFQTKNRWTLAVSGTGHAAMEAACVNLLQPGELAVVCTNGIWGERFSDMVQRAGARSVVLRRDPGEVFTVAEVEAAVSQHHPQLVFVTHVESSTGTLQPLEGLGDACHRHGALLLVDSVAGAGGVPLFMDRWSIDCLYTGSQKCLGCAPGICPISFSERARDKIMSRETRISSFYLDMTHLTNYWQCEETDPPEPRRYHHTGPISLVYGLREALRLLAQEGLEQSWSRHQHAAEKLHDSLQHAPFSMDLLVKHADHRAPTVTTIKVPAGMDWKRVVSHSMNSHQVEIAGGLGPTVGQVFRIGLMGVNATPESVERVLAALRDSLEQVKKSSL